MMQHSWDAVLLSAVALIAALDGSSPSLSGRSTAAAAPETNVNVIEPVNFCAVPNNRSDVEIKDSPPRHDGERCELKDDIILIDDEKTNP